MPQNTSNIDQINRAISGLTLSQLENIFRDPKFKKMFKDLTKTELKQIKIQASVSGLDNVEDLVEAFNNASGASEEYFRKLDKYRSTTKAMNLAFKEGSEHMREYLDAANKTGGRMAVTAAAITYLAKSFNEQMESLRDAALASRQYRIEQDLFSKSSLYSKKSLDGFRTSLNLTKNDMAELYDVLGSLESQGFGIDEIKAKFDLLQGAYGPRAAMGLIKDWQNIMTNLPTLASQKGNSPSTSDVYNMMNSGVYDKYLKIKYAGGATEAAELSNHDKFVESRMESIKDSLLNKIPTAMFDISKGIGVISGSTAALMPIMATLGAIQTILTVIAVKNSGGLGSLGGIGAGAARVGKSVGSIGGLGLAAALGIGAGTELMRSTYGVSQHGYKPSYKEMLSAVKQYGLSYTGGGPVEESFDKTSNKTSMMGLGEKRFSQIFNLMDSFEKRWDYYYQDMKQVNDTMLGISIRSGKSAEYLKNISEYSKNAEDEYKKQSDFYGKQITKIENIRTGLEKSGSFGEDQQKAYESDISKARKGLAESQKSYFESIQYVLDKEAEKFKSEGGVGFKRLVGLRASVASGGVAVERAELAGGDVAALRNLRSAKIELAKSDLVAFENIEKNLLKRKEEKQTDEELAIINEELIKNSENMAGAQRNLNDAIKDTSDLDNVIERMNSLKGVFDSLSGYISNVDGSFAALQPLLLKNIEFAKEEERIAKEKYDRLVKENGGENSKPVQLARDAWANKQIATAEEMFNYTKMERDKRLEVIEMESTWQKEQADFYAEMGGHFGDVLSMRTSAVQKERESIAVLENYLSSGMLSGKERFAAEIELERKKMNITRESIGIQKDAYEKFVGMAFGKLGDVGFKRGRMDDAVLMGTSATRVKNRAGMYVGGGVGMNRDQQTALTATGFNAAPTNYGGYIDQEMIRGELQAKQASGLMGSEVQKVDVQTHVTVEPSKEFNIIVKETVINVMKTMGKSIGRTN